MSKRVKIGTQKGGQNEPPNETSGLRSRTGRIERIARSFSPIPEDDTLLMLFSGGKDSIVVGHLLKKYLPNQKIAWVYFYLVDGLRYVESTLKYYERRWGITVHRRPCHETLSIWAARDNKCKKKYSYGDTEKAARAEFAATWVCDGIKKADSLARVGLLKRCVDGVNPSTRSIHPIHDWSHKKVTAYCKIHKLPVPSTYAQGMNRSIWVPDALTLIWMRSNLPEDYQRIITALPEMGDAVFKKLGRI